MADPTAVPSPRPREAREVNGYCPMGCGATLARWSDGTILCTHPACTVPTAVDSILSDQETEHIVVLRPGDFTIRHPLRERLDDELMTCRLHKVIASFDSPPDPPGRYRVTGGRGDRMQVWSWERLDG